MGVILGIDIGGSSTKIVGLAPDLSVIDMLRVKADDPLTSLYGAMGNFLSTHHLQLSDIRHIALTGVGSSYVEGDIYGVKTIKVEEFPSVGVGGLALSRKERAVVVSMGTGTSLLWAEKGGEIRGKLNGIGFAQLLNMDVDTSQHLVVRDVSLQGSRLALPGSAAQENMPAEIRQQLEALDDEWHQQHNRFSEQQKCLFIPVEWLGRIEASLQDVGAQIKQAKQP